MTRCDITDEIMTYTGCTRPPLSVVSCPGDNYFLQPAVSPQVQCVKSLQYTVLSVGTSHQLCEAGVGTKRMWGIGGANAAMSKHYQSFLLQKKTYHLCIIAEQHLFENSI